jgi:putative PIN family toxin of toxin-antitoxin system
MKKPRIVVDTNVLVAASRNSEGPAFALMNRIRQGDLLLCCSPALFLEYEDVLKRKEQRAVSGWTLTDVDAVLAELASLIEPVAIHYHWRPQLRDAADEMVLEAAVNARVAALISYNQRDFQPAATQFNLPLFSPEQALRHFNLLRKSGATR